MNKVVKKLMTLEDAIETLGLARSFSEKDLKHAFKVKCLKYHPDNHETGDEKKFKYVVLCYEFIKKNVAFDLDGKFVGVARRIDQYDQRRDVANFEDLLRMVFGGDVAFGRVIFFTTQPISMKGEKK